MVLLDTSVLARTLQPLHPQLETARTAIKALTQKSERLCVVAQNLIELWVVATRPLKQNGLGMSPLAAEAEPVRIGRMFDLLPETPAIYPVWEN